jgi:predicted RNA-binding Zn-ribbon protein involved in translation (DUF1610 family)
MVGCAWCGTDLAVVGNAVGRRDTCPRCGHDLHACRQCRHFDPAVAKMCKEPMAEVPSDKDEANFCEFFQLGEGGFTDEDPLAAARAAAEALFGPKA